jgi:ABC-2 type transport system permease protein
MSWRRIWGVMLRHIYNFNGSLDKWIDAFYWPLLDITVWGLTFSALRYTHHDIGTQITMILTGIILWYIIWRGQYEITITVLEEFWGTNLINLLGSPLKVSEWIIALLLLGLMKLAMTLTFTSLVAFLLYSVNIFDLGWFLLACVPSLLMTGWVFGLFIAGLFLRFGTNIQSVAWAGAFVLMPCSATFYPLSTLPCWAQYIAAAFPSSYIFESMRSLLQTGTVSTSAIITSFVLNAVYFVLASLFFISSFKSAKKKGISHLK